MNHIRNDEWLRRIEKSKELMALNKIDAIFVESGPALSYFTGLNWGRSERTLALIIPARGEASIICPAFEEGALRERLKIDLDLHLWHEEESPFKLTADILSSLKIRTGRLGINEDVRYFISNGLQSALPQLECTSAEPVIRPMRACKSENEISLMKQATEINIAVFKECMLSLHEGIMPARMRDLSQELFSKHGIGGGLSFQFGISSSFPHGLKEELPLRENEIVLMDGCCSVDGYFSDISRTIVFGKPSEQQRNIWELEKRAQTAAFDAATPGTPCEEVDAAARRVICEAGFGPDYNLPGLPHRTGHGIGLQIHEHEYIVKGNRTPLAPGMCFTNEPMIVIPNEFGVRLEDDVYITPDGQQTFSEFSPSIDEPFEGFTLD